MRTEAPLILSSSYAYAYNARVFVFFENDIRPALFERTAPSARGGVYDNTCGTAGFISADRNRAERFVSYNEILTLDAHNVDGTFGEYKKVLPGSCNVFAYDYAAVLKRPPVTAAADVTSKPRISL